MKNKDIDRINEWLDRTYGHDLLKRPYWRVIWSVGIIEKRKGLFQDFYGHIFIREFYGVREVPKYQYHPSWREKWILEKLMFDLPNEEIMLDYPGSYEPIYVFYDKAGNYIKPTLDAVKYFLYLMLHAPKVKYMASDLDRMEQEEVDKEAEHFYGIMDDKFGGDIATAIHQGEGVSYCNPGVILKPDGKPHWFDNRREDASNDSKSSSISDKRKEAGVISS